MRWDRRDLVLRGRGVVTGRMSASRACASVPPFIALQDLLCRIIAAWMLFFAGWGGKYGPWWHECGPGCPPSLCGSCHLALRAHFVAPFLWGCSMRCGAGPMAFLSRGRPWPPPWPEWLLRSTRQDAWPTGGTSPRSQYATPPPPPCPPGQLSCQGSTATGHTYSGAEGARNFFFIPSTHFVHFAPQHYP